VSATVELAGIDVSLDGRSVLAGVDLVRTGGLTTVLGANGAGKTTLLRCMATLLRPSAGRVRVDGLDPDQEQERIEIRRRLGYLPQQVGTSPGATVFDSLDVLAVMKEYRDDRRRHRVVFDELDRVGLRDRATDCADALSGGMRRRLGLAAALLGSPTLLVLDEPTAGLDPDERLRLRDIVVDRKRTATVVMSTHQTDDAEIADTVVVLADTRVAFVGSPAALTARAGGRVWLTDGPLPPPGVRASWRRADGRLRCLGTPPPDAELVSPTLEDGYLLVTSS